MEGLLDVLCNAASQNPELVKVGEQQLKDLETQAGFYSALMVVILNRSLEANVRWLASVCLKNGIDRYWRKIAPNSIPNEEKIALKQNLLLCFDEPENIIATQIALTISKVSRIDWPSEWSELFPTLLHVIQRPEEIYQQRGILVLHHVIKTLASKRLVADQLLFQQVTVSMFPISLDLWNSCSTMFIQEVKNGQGNHKSLLEKCFFCLKVLKSLLIYGFKKPADDSNAVGFVRIIFEQFKPFLELRKYFMASGNLLELLDKYLVLLVKVLTNLLTHHPVTFIPFIRHSLECTVLFCFSEEYKGVLFERFTVGLFNLIKLILTSLDYKKAITCERWDNTMRVRRDADLVNAEPICKQFFTPPVVTEVIKQLVYRYIALPETNIDDWKEFPEDFVLYQLSETWKYNVRPSAESLFLALFRKYEDLVLPIVLDMIKSLPNLESTDYGSIIRKEAILTVIGLSYFYLFNRFNFEQFLVDVIIPELQNNSPNYILVRRRILWLIGQSFGSDCSSEKRVTCFRIIVDGMDASQSIGVRLAAIDALKEMVTAFEFQEKEFVPFLDKAITSMYHFLKEVQECDLKLSVLHVLSLTVSRMRNKVRNYLDSLMRYLLELWQKSGEQYMLQCAIISCFTEIVHSLRKLSCKLHPVLVPMIHSSTDARLPSHIYVVEDALLLWQSVIENTHTCTTELLLLAQNLLPHLECGQSILDKTLDILKAYLILAPQEFLERYGENIVNTFTDISRDMSTDENIRLLKFVHLGLVVAPNQCALIFKPILASTVSTILEDENQLSANLSFRLCALSRVALNDLNCFASILQMVSTRYSQNLDTTLEYLLEVWLKSMQSSAIERRKLCCLALLSLLTKDSQIILHNICGILLASVEVLNDLVECDSVTDIASNIDLLALNNDQFCNEDETNDDEDEEYYNVSQHENRKAKLERLDPANTVNLKDFLKSQLSHLEHKLGPEKFQDLMSTVDAETMQQLYTHLQM